MSEQDKEFIQYVKEECRRNGIKFLLKPVKYFMISRKFRCGGYFDCSTGVLACAENNSDYFEVLVHEFCHMQQWLDPECHVWEISENSRSLEKLNEWFSGKKVHNIKKHLAIVRDLELDTEMRAVEIIKKFNLSIDIERYIQKSNAYVQSYNRMGVTRKWVNKKVYNTEVVDSMPKSFDMDYENYSKEIDDIFEKQERTIKKTRSKDP